MSKQVTFDYSKTGSFISQEEIGYMKKLALDAKEVLVSKSGAGNDFLGWIDLPVDYDKEEFARIKAAAKKIQSDSEVLLVIGIGHRISGTQLLQCSEQRAEKDSRDLFLRKFHQLHLFKASDGSGGRQGFLHQHDLQVRYHHGACHRVPRL